MIELVSKFNHPSLFRHDLFDNLFDDLDKGLFKYDVSIPYNVESTLDSNNQPKEQRITFALAGYKKEQISVKVLGDQLLLNISKANEAENSSVIVHHKGICQRSVQLKWFLGGMIDKKNIKTKFADGLLTITLPFIVEEETVVDIG